MRTDLRLRALLTKIILSSSELETPESFLLLWIGSESDLLILFSSPVFAVHFLSVFASDLDCGGWCDRFELVSRSSGMSSHIAESLLGTLVLFFWKILSKMSNFSETLTVFELFSVICGTRREIPVLLLVFELLLFCLFKVCNTESLGAWSTADHEEIISGSGFLMSLIGVLISFISCYGKRQELE